MRRHCPSALTQEANELLVCCWQRTTDVIPTDKVAYDTITRLEFVQLSFFKEQRSQQRAV